MKIFKLLRRSFSSNLSIAIEQFSHYSSIKFVETDKLVLNYIWKYNKGVQIAKMFLSSSSFFKYEQDWATLYNFMMK